MSSVAGKDLKNLPGHVLTSHVEKQLQNNNNKKSEGIMKGGRQVSPAWMIYLILTCRMSIITQIFYIDQACSAKCNAS